MRALAETYRLSWRYALCCPLLFLLPMVVEIVQHWAEVRLGFYDSLASMQAAEGAPLRMVLGHAKVFTLFLAGYWSTRFYAWRDPVAAARWDPAAVALFVPVMLWGLLWLVVIQDGPALWNAAGGAPATAQRLVLFLLPASMAFEVCLAAWKVSAATGRSGIGFVQSVRLTLGSYWWALGVTLAVTLPLMVVHYGFAFAALGRSPLATWAFLVVDALVVAYMTAAMMAANFVVARRIGERQGVTLWPPRPEGEPSTSAFA